LLVRDTLTASLLLYGCEVWTLEGIGVKKLKTAEMNFIRYTAGYNLLDHRRNEDILEDPIKQKLAQYKQKKNI
jgi:hypothetical protein